MKRKVIIQRGEDEDYFMHEFEMESGPGMVVLDAIHHIQANDARCRIYLLRASLLLRHILKTRGSLVSKNLKIHFIRTLILLR